MRENLKMDKEKGLVLTTILTEIDTEANGKMIKRMAKEFTTTT